MHPLCDNVYKYAQIQPKLMIDDASLDFYYSDMAYVAELFFQGIFTPASSAIKPPEGRIDLSQAQ